MFGPLHITLISKTLKEAQVVIFACMTARAELVNDRRADASLMAFRHFVSLWATHVFARPTVEETSLVLNVTCFIMYMLPVKFDFRFKNFSSRLLLNFLCLLGLGVERKLRIHLHWIKINLKNQI